jgi:hypothetical protein
MTKFGKSFSAVLLFESIYEGFYSLIWGFGDEFAELFG